MNRADSELVRELRMRADMIEELDKNGRPRNVTIMREAADAIERLSERLLRPSPPEPDVSEAEPLV